jgi:aspartokinase-like uncharacterized kinase
MNAYEVMAQSPWLTFFLALSVSKTIRAVFFILPHRLLRSIDIRKHGWPPPHCDADGDFKEEGR